MRVKSVGIRVKDQSKLGKKVLKPNKYANIYKKRVGLQEISPFLKEKAMLRNDLAKDIQKLSEIIDLHKQNEAKRQITIQVNEYYAKNVSKKLNSNSNQEYRYLKKRKTKQQIRMIIQKQLYPHLIDLITNLFAAQHFIEGEKISIKEQMMSLKEQVRQPYQEDLEQSLRKVFMQKLAQKNKVININEINKGISVPSTQIVEFNVKEEIDSKDGNAQFKKDQFKNCKQECLNEKNVNTNQIYEQVELSNEITGFNIEKSRNFESQVRFYHYEKIKEYSNDIKFLSNQTNGEMNQKYLDQKCQFKCKKYLNSQILLIKDCFVVNEKKQIPKIVISLNQINSSNTIEIIFRNVFHNLANDLKGQNQEISMSLSQTQRRYLLNLILNNKISQFNKKLINIHQQQKSIQNNKNSQHISKKHQLNLSEISFLQYSQSLKIHMQQQLSIKKNIFDMKKEAFQKECFSNNQIQFSCVTNQQHQQSIINSTLSQKLCKITKNNQFKCQFKVLEDKLLGGGGVCGSKSKVGPLESRIEQKQKKMKQIINGKGQLEIDFQIQSDNNDDQEVDDIFKDFNEQYNKYINTSKVSEKVIETHVRLIIEDSLHKFREQIVQQDIRHKVIDMINLLINYLLIIRQNNSTQSIQSDINQVTDKLETLIIYCKENKERHPCLDLYQYFEILKTLNSQRQGLDEANKSVAIQIIQKVIQVTKFGAGFVSIAGAIKNLTEINLKEINEFINQIKQIVQKLTSDSSTGAIKIGLDSYSDYNSNNIANNMQALWLRKVQYMGDSLSQSDPIQEIIFYLEESPKIINKDTQLFIYMQLNYLLSKQKLEDNFKKLSEVFKDSNKNELITKLSNSLQVKEFSDSVIDKLKNIANLIAQNNQFRYIKAQLLLYFAQIIQLTNKNEFTDIMTDIISNYLQEKQKSVKIVYRNNQIMADFIHNHLNKTQILTQIDQFKQQMAKHLDNKQQYNDFAYDISNEKELDRQLAKYFVEMWEQSVKQRQKKLEITHKDDVLLEAIHLYVNQQITYSEGYKIDTKEKDAVKQIIQQFLIPNFVLSQDDIQQQNENQQNLQRSNQSSCKIISILAEGGSGKSMLLKKLEFELLNRDSEYTKDFRSEFIPFIIKFNSLDREKPSIEDYLESLNIKRKDIDNLKKSERNKLIMLDGYDEYTGNYFKVYQKLQLNEWVNTLVIVTSRLEKITVSDAKLYFNYYDQQGNQGDNNSFSILKLEKITVEDINDYLQKYKKQSQNQKDFNPQSHDKLQEIIFKNKQLTNLLKLPINLYLTTRMIIDINLNDENTSKAFQEFSDQIEIQELFFSQQFKKQSQIFIEQQQQLKLNEKQRQELLEKIESCYFEYFQSIAMHMFIQKGQKSNYLSITRDSIQFKPREDVSAFFKQNKLKIDDIIKKLHNYVDSRAITKIKLKLDEDNAESSQNEKQKVKDDETQQEFEFRHKSLFEYFAARAIKYDFDLHKENIFKLDISQLKKFNINKKIIMSNQKNSSEQQILLKLYKLMLSDIQSSFFKKTYYQEDISKANRYIQYLKKSTISKQTEKSEIDVGASNLLSALYLSKLSYPSLTFKKCSFSQAYIINGSPKLAIFNDCNLNDSLIYRQNLENFETSNTKNAIFDNLQKHFGTDDIYSFMQAIFYKNTLVTISKTGYINQFEINQNIDQCCKKLKSKHIINDTLKRIYFINTKNIFVVLARKSLFEINAETFDIINTFSFNYIINSFAINNSKYIVTFQNYSIFYGDIQNGFTLLDQIKIQADQILSINNKILTYQNKEINIYNLSNLQLVKNIKNFPCNFYIASLTPDGKYLAAQSSGNTCKIWNIENGLELVYTIQEHKGDIYSICFSNDGKYLATSSEDKTCMIWNVEKGFELLQTIEEKDHSFFQYVSFSQNGQYLVTISRDISCKIWSIEKGFEFVNKIEGHTQIVQSVAFSPDGKYLATSSFDQTYKIWNIEKGYDLVNTIQGHTDKITYITFSSNSKLLATASYDKTCKIWQVEKGFELIISIETGTDWIPQLSFSTNGKYLAGCSNDKTCKVWNLENHFELQYSIEGHTGCVKSVAFSPDSKYLATGSHDRTFKIWNVEQGFKLAYNIETQQQQILSIAFSPDGKYLASSSQDHTCKIWNAVNGYEFINKIEGHTGEVKSVAFSPDNKYLATGSNDHTSRIWNVEKGFELINCIKDHMGYINQVAFSTDSKYVVTGSDDYTCKVWNIEKGFELINIEEKHKSIVSAAAFSIDGQYLVTCSYDKTFKIWDAQKEFELINTKIAHTKTIKQVSFSQDGRYLATCSQDQTCKIFNVEKGFELIKTIEQGHTGSILTVAFSSNSRYLATGSQDNTCKIWDVDNEFELIKSLQGHTGEILKVCFSIDEKYLATCSQDNTCRIWNVENEFQLYITIEAHTESIACINFSRDGRFFATGSWDYTCKIWDVKNGFQLMYTLEGYAEGFSALAFSKDSKYLVTGSFDSNCKIWDIQKGFVLINIIHTYYTFIHSIQFSPDGKYLTISQNSCTSIWDLEKGFKFINMIEECVQDISSFAFSADGNYFGVSLSENKQKVWNIETGFDLLSKDDIEKYNIKLKSNINQDKNMLIPILKNLNIFKQVYQI